MTEKPEPASIFAALYASNVKQQIFADLTSKSKRRSTPADPGGSGGIKGLNTRTGSPRIGKSGSKGFYSPPGRSSRINPIAKFSYVKNNKDGQRHLIQHCYYLEFRERGRNEPQRQWHSRDRDNIPRDEVIKELLDNRGSKVAMFKVILSPNNNELKHEDMARQVMEQWQEKIGLNIDYAFVKHSNTAHIHLHFLLHGTTVEGRDYRIRKTDIYDLREIAFQHQYEVEYQLVKDNYHLQQELAAWREDQQLAQEFLKNLTIIKDLDLYRPAYDKQAQEDLGINKYYHPDNLWLPPDEEHLAHMEQLRKDHPELFPGLSVTSREDKEAAHDQIKFLYAINNPEPEMLQRENIEPRNEVHFRERINPTAKRLYDLIENDQGKEIRIDRLAEVLIDLTHAAGKINDLDPSQPPAIDNLERDNDRDAISVLWLASKIDDQRHVELEHKEIPPEIFLWQLITGESELTISTDVGEIDYWQDDYAAETSTETNDHNIEASSIELQIDMIEDDRERDDED